MFKSATVSLTLWYVLLAMGLSFLFSGVVYHFSTGELTEALHNQYQVLSDHDRGDRSYVPTHELDTRSHHLLKNLVYFNILVLTGSSLASYILARKTLRPIEAAHQAQIRFTADASHELRTPLAAMKADTEATLMTSPDNAALLRRALKDNLVDIEKLDKLTDHLVEISRYDSKAAVAEEDVELGSIIKEVIRQFNRRIKDNGLKIKVETEPAQVHGDMHGLSQLITIILDNAIKYSNPKGQINVALLRKNRGAIITVKDHGIGIPAGDLPHIFERFYRSQNVNTNKKKSTGYGLGLPLAKDIVDIHGGTIVLHSKEHEGTTVTITLPVV
jgi:signal transduction histidine kinase